MSVERFLAGTKQLSCRIPMVASESIAYASVLQKQQVSSSQKPVMGIALTHCPYEMHDVVEGTFGTAVISIHSLQGLPRRRRAKC